MFVLIFERTKYFLHASGMASMRRSYGLHKHIGQGLELPSPWRGSAYRHSVEGNADVACGSNDGTESEVGFCVAA